MSDVLERLQRYLLETIEADGEQRTRIARLAELVDVNGGFGVGGWGIIRYGGGTYGRKGLEQNEAFELMEVNAWLRGVTFACPEARELIQRMFDQELECARRASEETAEPTP